MGLNLCFTFMWQTKNLNMKYEPNPQPIKYEANQARPIWNMKKKKNKKNLKSEIWKKSHPQKNQKYEIGYKVRTWRLPWIWNMKISTDIKRNYFGGFQPQIWNMKFFSYWRETLYLLLVYKFVMIHTLTSCISSIIFKATNINPNKHQMRIRNI